jgi:predicted ATPase/DNA-binding winged helix-turn-helix (wHTH) protein
MPAIAKERPSLSDASSERTFLFGPFRLMSEQRSLREIDRSVRLGGRAMDILVALVENAGEVVSNEDLVAKAWPKTHVDDLNNLRVHIAAIRKVLGDGRRGIRYIANVVGRGYSFVAPVSITFGAATNSPVFSVSRVHNLPAPVSRIVGRSDSVAEIADMVMQHHFVTVTGAGGIGKTTVAVAVAESIASANGLDACFVDLAKLTDPGLVPDTLASALGLSVISDDPIPSLAELLGRKRILIVLDNCEHVVDAAARLAEVINGIGPDVKLLTTSREPLHVQREWVHRLSPLATPEPSKDDDGISAASAMGFSAVELFVERASSSMDAFELSDANAAAISEFCRKLDGIPLAIELAASQLQLYGIEGLSARFDDFFRMMSIGRRTKNTRHQTLRAAMDWSFSTLSDKHRAVIRRLAVFAGPFDMLSAVAIGACPVIKGEDVFEAVISLSEKSLIAVDISGENAAYRLLETTRAYATDQLVASGERPIVARRHALYCLECFSGATTDWDSAPQVGSVAAYRNLIDDVRSAIDWAFAPQGDPRLGVQITAASAPLWFHLSVIQEYKGRLEHALNGNAPDGRMDPWSEMQLNAALGHALFHTRGPVPRMAEAFQRVLTLSDDLEITDHKARAYWGLCSHKAVSGDYRSLLEFATKFHAFSATLPHLPSRCLGIRMMGLASHAVGDEAAAQKHLEFILAQPVEVVRRDKTSTCDFDPRTSSKGLLGVILWIRGFPDQASRTIEDAIGDAVVLSHPVSLCYALACTASPVSLWSGDLSRARRYNDLLLEQSRLHSLPFWNTWGMSFDAVCSARERGVYGTPESDIPSFRSFAAGSHLEMLATVGYATPEFLDRPENDLPSWCHAEILRMQGDRAALADEESAAAKAEELYRRSIAFARHQGALSWELRSATSLAKLMRMRKLPKDCLAEIAPVYGRFTEGFETADIRAAAALIADLEA